MPLTRLAKIVALGTMVLLAGCASSISTSHLKSINTQNKHAYLVCERELDHLTIHHAITEELQKRGYQVTDLQSTLPSQKRPGILVTYLDQWRWDLVMFLSVMTVTIKDASTGEVIATGIYDNRVFFHDFGDSKEITKNIFADFDKKKVLR